MEFSAERKHALYLLTHAAGKIGLGIFFQRLEVRHPERIPATGPAVFVANHPNSIMDALVLGVALPRKVNYLAHAGLFRHPFLNRLLRSCGTIPVHRRQDDPNQMTQNTAAFQSCYEALEQGETIGIFPEGTSDMLRKVKKIKTGAARIVLETESRNGYDLGVRLIPVGLHFFSRSRFRSRVLVNIGEAVPLVKHFTQYHADPVGAVVALTQEIQKRLEQLTVHVQDEELDDFVRDLEQIYRDEITAEWQNPGGTSSSFQEFLFSQKIAEAVHFYQKHDPQQLTMIRDRMAVYKRKLARLHLRDEWLRDRSMRRRAGREWAKAILLAFVGFPAAAYGIVNNFLPYCIAETVARRFLEERTKILTALLLAGGIAFLCFYVLQTALVAHGLGWGGAILYAASLPLSGFWALAYVKRMRAYRARASFSLSWWSHRQLIQRLRLERRHLIKLIAQAHENYRARQAPQQEMAPAGR